jgi:Flagellar biosynthesis protein, FliO
MIAKIRIPRFASPGSSLAPAEMAMEPVRMSSTFHAALTDSADDWVMHGTSQAVFAPRPEVTEVQQPSPGVLARAWGMLQTKYALTTTKRLRVAETVSLGEKRFVSIVSVGGREFLIGGGTSGVSLLAQLSPAGEFTGVGLQSTAGDAR